VLLIIAILVQRVALQVGIFCGLLFSDSSYSVPQEERSCSHNL